MFSKHKEKTEREDEAAVIRKVVRKEDTLKKVILMLKIILEDVW